MNHFYERNSYILEHDINKKFEEVLWMTDDEFRQWVTDMRKTIVYAWDELGMPPRVGYNENAIIDQFNKLDSFPVFTFEMKDELTGKRNCVRNTSAIGNAANQWFPTMMKTRINYKANDDGRSIYDHFADPELLEKVIKYARRHFKRDSFYHYSLPVKANDKENFLFHCETGEEWIQQFEEKERPYGRSDYWIAPKKEDAEYTGYNEDLKGQKWLTLNRQQVDNLNIPDKCKTNIDYIETDNYQIRYFKYDQKLFPVGLKAFRISFCQYAVNFPPLTARYLYEKYTQHIVDDDDYKREDSIVVYDPSAGWGGRILGAMGVRDDRTIHYIGTDPNTDHEIENGTRTKYEDLAEFYNTKTNRSNSLFPHTNTYQIFRDGSECIQDNPEFKRYRNSIDLIFTSPPYFAKEAYSEDEAQSYKKFPDYSIWKDEFLRPTLETCVEWLKPNRYLLWNIADAKFGNNMLPLEKDSSEILESLGMKYVDTLKMTLAQMPGGNRLDAETGKPKAKNFVKILNESGKEIWLKYEPIFIWKKE